MGVSTHDLFGDGTGASATPGDYGIAPPGYRLPADTRLGAVRLQVADLERSLAFYQTVVGLRLTETDGALARLAPHGDSQVILELQERPGSTPAGRRRALGLFHVAILVPDRATLGRFVRHLTERGVAAGAGDHLVSEAFYLSDPDGLGLEVYADRPRDTWRRRGRELMMATDPVDVSALLRSAGDLPWDGMPSGTVIGHVHLHVGDLEAARAFYSDALGLDRMGWSYPGALFLAAGGYHHHLGTNTWAGAHARSPDALAARLLHWSIVLPTAADVAAVAEALAARGVAVERLPMDGIAVRDPWGTMLQVHSAVAQRSPHA